jgi:hypothetical protein
MDRKLQERQYEKGYWTDDVLCGGGHDADAVFAYENHYDFDDLYFSDRRV